MKTYISILIVVCLVLTTTSCGITQKFLVSGEPGTEIYDPLMDKVGVIDNTGKAKIVFKSKDYNKVYVAYLMAHKAGSDQYIPFALNYKNAKLAHGKILGYGVLPALAVGGIGAGLISTSDIAGGVMMGAGLGVGFASLVYWGVYEAFASPSDKFRYLKEQNTIQDFYFTKPVFTSEVKMLTLKPSVSAKNNNNQSDYIENEGSALSRKTLGDKSRKSLKDFGQAIEGVYKGIGTLTDKNGNIIEEYSEIEIEISRVDNKNVTINVIDDNGEQFFVSPNPYKVSKGSNGNYSLSHSKIQGADVLIDKNGKATYKHPKVNIDGDMYTLKISALAK